MSEGRLGKKKRIEKIELPKRKNDPQPTKLPLTAAAGENNEAREKRQESSASTMRKHIGGLSRRERERERLKFPVAIHGSRLNSASRSCSKRFIQIQLTMREGRRRRRLQGRASYMDLIHFARGNVE